MADALPKSFEEKLQRIEAIARELETGSVDLQRAVDLFKEGKTLSRECEALLKGAQEQIDRAGNDEPPVVPG